MNTIISTGLLALGGFISLITLDGLWLGLLARNLYRQELGNLMRTLPDGSYDVLYSGAVLVYVAMIIGLLVFVVPLGGDSLIRTLGYGALLGFIIYAVYEGTNYALVSEWPARIVLIDIAWGTFLLSASGGILFFLNRFLNQL